MPLPPLNADALRRAILFSIATGAPVCAGVWLDQPAGALLGCVVGLWLSFADEEGALSRRLTILALAAGSIALGGATGLALHGFPPPFWVLFVAMTFAIGMFTGIGKAPTISTRFGTIAMVVTADAPQFHLTELWYALGVLVLVSVARLTDHALFGPLAQQKPNPRSPPAGGWVRFALAHAGAATASLWLGLAIDPSRVLWVVVSTLLMMQPDARASYVRIVQRIVGTVLGVIAAYAITRVVTAPWLIAACVLAITPFIPHHLHNRYWLHTALIALLVLLAYDLATLDPRVLRGLFTERLEDVLLGASIALIGTVAAFPRAAPEEA
jgi:uncharacterized membrane protein YccC